MTCTTCSAAVTDREARYSSKGWLCRACGTAHVAALLKASRESACGHCGQRITGARRYFPGNGRGAKAMDVCQPCETKLIYGGSRA